MSPTLGWQPSKLICSNNQLHTPTSDRRRLIERESLSLKHILLYRSALFCISKDVGFEQLCERGLFCIKTFLGHDSQPLTNAFGVTSSTSRRKCSQLQSGIGPNSTDWSIGPAVPVSVQQWQAVHSRQVLPEDEQGWAMLHFPNINIQINEASMKKLSLNLDPHKASRPDEICPCVLKLEKRAHGWNIIHTDSHLPVFHQHWSCSTWPRRMPILHQCSRGENSRIQPTTEPYP